MPKRRSKPVRAVTTYRRAEYKEAKKPSKVSQLAEIVSKLGPNNCGIAAIRPLAAAMGLRNVSYADVSVARKKAFQSLSSGSSTGNLASADLKSVAKLAKRMGGLDRMKQVVSILEIAKEL